MSYEHYHKPQAAAPGNDYFSQMILIFSILFIGLIGESEAVNCKNPHEKFIGNRCYAFVPKKQPYAAAEEYCHSHGYSLATVDTVITANFLASSAATEFGSGIGQFWIGLSRKKDYSLFFWDDGTSVAYTNFEAGFPNTKDYVAENVKNGRWQTLAEHKELEFVCSYDPSVTPTPLPTTTTTTVKTTTTAKTTTVKTTTRATRVTTQTPTTTVSTTTKTTVPPTTTPRSCPQGFTLFEATQKCYIVLVYGNDSDYPDVPDDAPYLTRENQRCSKYGATVATIHSSDLNDLFRSLIYDRFNDTRYATIGLRNTDLTTQGGKWQWYDGTATDYLDFGNMFPKTGDFIAQTSSQGFWVTYTHTAPNEGVVCSVDF
uniref:C-type lectin domain-containing protein n=2 Tax=Caenorhabditis tropicalis TaxID=1561998 RepID=A0A1I7T112_9PELO